MKKEKPRYNKGYNLNSPAITPGIKKQVVINNKGYNLNSPPVTLGVKKKNG